MIITSGTFCLWKGTKGIFNYWNRKQIKMRNYCYSRCSNWKQKPWSICNHTSATSLVFVHRFLVVYGFSFIFVWWISARCTHGMVPPSAHGTQCLTQRTHISPFRVVFLKPTLLTLFSSCICTLCSSTPSSSVCRLICFCFCGGRYQRRIFTWNCDSSPDALVQCNIISIVWTVSVGSCSQ